MEGEGEEENRMRVGFRGWRWDNEAEEWIWDMG